MPTLKKSIPFRLISSTIPDNTVLDFDLPPELEASEPPEVRGLARDEVRLMVSYRADNRVIHTQFRELNTYLDPGDLLVINTSGTMNAALQAKWRSILNHARKCFREDQRFGWRSVTAPSHIAISTDQRRSHRTN